MTDETTTPSPADAAAAVAAAGTAAPPTPAPELTGPWADQLKSSFEDPDQQAAVDAFLRSTVQPYVTKLEQSAADLTDAQRLYDDLNQNPGETFLAIAEELFGEDGAARVTEALRTGEAVVTPEGEVAATSALSPEDKALLDHVRETKEAGEYEAALSAFVADGHEDVKTELFHPFVHAAEGDFEVAYVGYKQFLEDWKTENGGATEDPSEDEVDTAPPALGASTAAGTTPPLQAKHQSIDEALDDFMAEQRRTAPPVGSV